MTGILKDFNIAIAYLDYIIIFIKTPQKHLLHIRMVFKKPNQQTFPWRRASAVSSPRNSVSRAHPQCYRYQTLTCQDTWTYNTSQPPTTPKQVRASLGLVRYYRKFIKGFAKIAKPLTLLTRQQVKFKWTPVHHTAFLHLKEAIVQATILYYSNPSRSTLSTLMPWTMHAEHNSHKSTMAWSFP